MYQNIFLTSFVFTFSLSVHGQKLLQENNAKKNSNSWNVFIEETHKVFIENKGQFDGMDSSNLINNNILFGVNCNGVDIFFTSTGITYRHDEIIKAKKKDNDDIEEENKKNTKVKTSYLNMFWKGANPNTQIVAENIVSNYFTYGDIKDSTGKTTIKASAYKKIIYKNIYPNIDIEYTFPENKQGIKYSIVLHPGANPKAIQMQYERSEKLFVDAVGNLRIESEFGEFIDHVPNTFYKEGTNIKSAFVVSNNIISFKLNELSNFTQQSIIIDPWTTIPVFAGTNKAYDIDWDFQGNIYIYGGQYPFQLTKLDSSGLIQWTFTGNSFYCQYGNLYGDFAVDRTNGTSFLCEGANNSSGTHILKVSTTGTQMSLVNTNRGEMWRIVYNSCTHKGMIGVGSTHVGLELVNFDNSLSSFLGPYLTSSANICHDITLITLDDTNCYLATARRANNDSLFDNVLIKCPLPNLIPTTYMVQDGYAFVELNSVQYYPNGGNGFNGIAKSPRFLYTYDGALLKQWNPNDGTLINSISVNTNSFLCGGVAVDACDNVYVGTLNGVTQYNSALTIVNSVTTPSAVYDVTLGFGDEIFTCGNGFVSALPLFSTCSSFSITTSFTNACSGNNGTASVSVIGGSPPFTYLWTPGGQITQTATGLSPDIYQVQVFEKNYLGCNSNISKTDTIAITAQPPISVIISGNTTICSGQSTLLTATTSGVLSYLWSTGETAQSISVSPTVTSTYSVTALNTNQCKTDTDFTITVLPSPVAFAFGDTTIFLGQSTTLNSTGGGDYLWNNGDTTNLISVTPTTTTIYCVIITGSNNCQDSACATVTIESPCDTAGAFFFPNAFSPNNDGQNDAIKIYYDEMSCIAALHLSIYDRWGELIYETDDPKFSWDGTYPKQILNTQVLAYHLTVGFTDGKTINRKGNISLVR